MNSKKFIEKAKKIHGDKYDYSKVEYVNSDTKVRIVCHNHGEFHQTPHNHLRGYGCPTCGGSKAMTTEEFVAEAKKVHGYRYDYTKVDYTNNHTKVCIICPEHGEFWQKPNHHLSGHGCGKCFGNRKMTSEEFVERARKVHGGKYDYSMVEYKNYRTKVCIICPEHGEFWQLPGEHLKGSTCPKCAGNFKKDTNDFISDAVSVHGEKYDYSRSEYVKCDVPIRITCPKHGDFWQVPYIHLQNHGCPKCSKTYSKHEESVASVFSGIEHERNNHSILGGKEIDIYIPSLKIGIEYNGLRWHSEEFGKDCHYHLDKLSRCNCQGIRLIQIFEDEWINHMEICKSKLRQICGLNDGQKIYARKCTVKEITDKGAAYDFLDMNHIQGRAGFTVALGTYYVGKLIGVMTFKKEREGFWDLNRFATDINYQCVGVGGKLFKYFTRNYEFHEIKSFADRRWTINPDDNLYTKIGFEFHSFVEPSYWYYNEKVDTYRRFHKFGFRKQKLSKLYGFPSSMTETEMTRKLGYTRIWDCGLIKYVFTNKNNLKNEKNTV